MLDGKAYRVEHVHGPARAALEVAGGEALAGGELVGRAQDGVAGRLSVRGAFGISVSSNLIRTDEGDAGVVIDDGMVEFTVARTFSSLYIAIDIAWLVVYAGILLYFKKRVAFLAGLVMGVVYLIVDYGVFYHLLGTRHITGADPFWFLLWLSMSYGLTNFAWIWLLLDRDPHAVEWSLLPILGWVAVGQLSSNFGDRFAEISISRGVGPYHGVMALLLLVGYLILIVRNLRGRDRVNILWLMAIGIGVQFAWEASLLLSGIRPPQWQPIVVNSLIETNLGIPYVYLVHRLVTRSVAREQPAELTVAA